MEKWRVERQLREKALEQKHCSRIMISLEEARSILQQQEGERDVEEVPLLCSGGRVIAGDIRALEAVPSFARSMLDGYALKASETRSASAVNPATFSIIEDVPAGSIPLKEVKTGMATKVLTGAPLPSGATAVIRDEEIQSLPAKIQVLRTVKDHEGTSPRGEEIREGEVVVKFGERLTAFHLGLLASLGIDPVTVFTQPEVGIFCTGSELTPVRSVVQEGKIRVTNLYMLSQLVHLGGGKTVDLGIAPDLRTTIIERVRQAQEMGIKLIISTGGAASGDFDLLLEAMEGAGFKIMFWKMALRPGAPVAVAIQGGTTWIGLSGNPSGAAVAMILLGVPQIARLAGKENPVRNYTACLARSLSREKGMRHFWWARWDVREGRLVVDYLEGQECSMIRSYINSNCLLELPPGSVQWPAGTPVNIWAF